jgi:hypothetical protein
MSAPDSTGVALQYVREELAAMRSDISVLAGELRGHAVQMAPRIAIVEHRIADIEGDLKAIQLAGTDDKKLRWTVITAVLVAVLAWIPDLLTLIGGH